MQHPTGGDLLDRTTAILLATLAALVVVAAALAAGETALVRVRQARARVLQDEHGRAGARAADLVDDIDRVLPAILFAALLVQVAAATVAGVVAARVFGAVAVAWSALLLTAVLFVYTELLPKQAAVRAPDRTLVRLAGPVRLVAGLLQPAVRVLRGVARLHSRDLDTASPTVTERELLLLAREAASEGQIDPSDRELIEATFRYGDRLVAGIMVPRQDIVAVPAGTTVGDAVDVAVSCGHRRLVVRGDQIDHVDGYVHLIDLLRHDAPGQPLDDLVRPTLFVPESKAIAALLRDMQQSWTHLAMVVDEYGTVAGLVTIEDIVEELLGAVAGEITPPQPGIRRVGARRWLVDADLPTDEVERATDLQLPSGPWNTIGGMAMGVAGRVLGSGDTVDGDGWRARVVAASGTRVRTVELTATGHGHRSDQSR